MRRWRTQNTFGRSRGRYNKAEGVNGLARRIQAECTGGAGLRYGVDGTSNRNGSNPRRAAYIRRDSERHGSRSSAKCRGYPRDPTRIGRAEGLQPLVAVDKVKDPVPAANPEDETLVEDVPSV